MKFSLVSTQQRPHSQYTRQGSASLLPGRPNPESEDFSLLHIVQTGSGAHPASYPMVTGELFLRRRPGREADH
jgi:hypothetical protein